MKIVTLDVQKREASPSAKELRRQNVIPAVFYGQGETSVPVRMDYQTFRRTYIKTGSSALIDLKVDGGEPKKVIVHDMQIHPLSGKIHHVDFLLVNLKEAINASIPVELVGEAPAVKDHGGILNTVKTELNVKCLPLDLPHEVKIDISGLGELGSSIHISDLAAIEGVEFLDGDEEVVVNVVAPRVEEEPEPTETEEGEEGGAEGETSEGGEEGGGDEEKSEEGGE